MDERIWTIAEILDKSGPMTADELAAQLKLSGKTVRSLIKTYAKEMQENGFCITAKPGRGFGIEITDAQTYVSGSKPQQGERTGIPQDAQERIQRLRQYLLEKDGYSKLDDLSEQFFVSRRSISNDLREVERQLAEYGLSIRRKPGYGICVVGRETNRRICIAAQRDESRSGSRYRSWSAGCWKKKSSPCPRWRWIIWRSTLRSQWSASAQGTR